MQPIYVAAGLAWESAERAIVGALLESDALRGRARDLVALSVDMRDVYAASHWAFTGTPPAYHTPDEDVYLPGRNIVLLSKAGVYCAMAGIDRLVLGTLGHNPFPDATPDFRAAMGRALSLGLAHDLAIEAYAQIERPRSSGGARARLPVRTDACMSPAIGIAGQPLTATLRTCSKCRERHDAFVDAGHRGSDRDTPACGYEQRA